MNVNSPRQSGFRSKKTARAPPAAPESPCCSRGGRAPVRPRSPPGSRTPRTGRRGGPDRPIVRPGRTIRRRRPSVSRRRGSSARRTGSFDERSRRTHSAGTDRRTAGTDRRTDRRESPADRSRAAPRGRGHRRDSAGRFPASATDVPEVGDGRALGDRFPDHPWCEREVVVLQPDHRVVLGVLADRVGELFVDRPIPLEVVRSVLDQVGKAVTERPEHAITESVVVGLDRLLG